MNKINNNVLALVLIALLCGTASAATTIYVGPGEINTTIQGAVNNVTSGDTIIVRDFGVYNENVNADVAHLTIRSENGSANCFVNASDPDDHVLWTIVNYVDITRFSVKRKSHPKRCHAGTIRSTLFKYPFFNRVVIIGNSTCVL